MYLQIIRGRKAHLLYELNCSFRLENVRFTLYCELVDRWPIGILKMFYTNFGFHLQSMKHLFKETLRVNIFVLLCA